MKTQKGQALIETALLLFIGVFLVSGLAFQFYRPLGIYFNKYMTEYVACLLDTGELPPLMGEVNADSECAGELTALQVGSLGSGTNSSGPGGSGSSGSAGGTNGANGSNGNSSSAGGDKGESSSSVGSRAAARRAAARSTVSRNLSRQNGAPGFGSASSQAQAGGDVAGDSDKKEIGTVKDGSGSFFKNNSSSSSEFFASDGAPRKKQIKAKRSLLNAAVRKAEREKNKIQSVGQIEVETSSSKPKKYLVSDNSRKLANVDDEDAKGLSFGKWLKYIAIIAILLAIVFIVGSQISQSSGGSD